MAVEPREGQWLLPCQQHLHDTGRANLPMGTVCQAHNILKGHNFKKFPCNIGIKPKVFTLSYILSSFSFFDRGSHKLIKYSSHMKSCNSQPLKNCYMCVPSCWHKLNLTSWRGKKKPSALERLRHEDYHQLRSGWLHSDFKNSLNYIARPWLKIKKNFKKKEVEVEKEEEEEEKDEED